MGKLVVYNWLIIAITALLVGVYVTIFEDFMSGKAYMMFGMAVICGAIFFYVFRKKKV